MTKQWQSTLIREGSTIEDAVRCLDETALQICLVVDEDNKLLGTITDGDIRRALLRGSSLQSGIADVMKASPIVAPKGCSNTLAIQFMKSNAIRQLPIVTPENKVIGLYLLDKLTLSPARPNTMVIMAGGKGKRLHPYTENCPKPLLEVSGKPMLQHIIERASKDGIKKFIISVHYLGQMIIDYFKDGNSFGVEIDYIFESSPLGTAGALGLIEHKFEEPVLVCNGDVMSSVHYGDILDYHNEHDAFATMAVRLHKWQNQFGVVNTDGIDIIGFEEKPIIQSNINAGIYVLSGDVVNALEKDKPLDMPQLFMQLHDTEKKAIVYPMHESWVDVGRPADYEYVNLNPL